jgi:exo-1,4-beta-D-glucosaminidase
VSQAWILHIGSAANCGTRLALLAENVYWQSAADDDLGEPKNDEQFKTNLAKWADVSDLNTMPGTKVKVSGNFVVANGHGVAKIRLTNDSNRVAFLLRAEITKGMDGEEVLPITYDDNYITIFPHEMRTIEGLPHFGGGNVVAGVAVGRL